MQFYRIILERPGVSADTSHRGDFAAAKLVAQGYAKHDREYVFVELIDIPVDKAGVLSLLQGYDPLDRDEIKPVRVWGISNRGGLKELSLEKYL